MNLSIVTSLYHSEPYIQEFYERITRTVLEITDDYEIIFVNDGSPDKSLDMVKELYSDDPHIRIINLSRNFGHHKALFTGIENSRGDLVFVIDCDLEESPESLKEIYDEYRSATCDVVFGIQKKRRGSWFTRVSGYLFYRIFNLLSNHKIANDLMTVRLMSRRYVNALVQHRDQELYLHGLMTITGFIQRPILLDKKFTGNSTYNLNRKIQLFIYSITSFIRKTDIGSFDSASVSSGYTFHKYSAKPKTDRIQSFRII